MANPLEAQGVRPTSVVSEAPKVGAGVSPFVERASVVETRPVEPVVGLRPAAVESSVLGAQPAATTAAQEVKSAPVVK